MVLAAGDGEDLFPGEVGDGCEGVAWDGIAEAQLTFVVTATRMETSILCENERVFVARSDLEYGCVEGMPLRGF